MLLSLAACIADTERPAPSDEGLSKDADAGVLDAGATAPDGGHATDGGHAADAGGIPDTGGGPPALTVPPGETIRLGDDRGYFDPEILQSPPKMVFTDRDRTVWLADLDPVTGRFKTTTGRELRVDTGHAPLADTNNGPELGVDRRGWSIVYTKPVSDAYALHWARPTADGFDIEIVPHERALLGATVSKAPNADATWAFAIRGAWNTGDAVALDLSAGSVDRIGAAVDGRTDGRWIDGRLQGVTTIVEGPDAGQLSLYDAVTKARRTITADPGEKNRPYGWAAPEADGRLRVLALVDGGAAIAVYEERASGPWPRVMTVPVPPRSGATRMSSPEPFVAQGRSFATATVVDDSGPTRSSQIWILDLGDPRGPGTTRCDGGEDSVLRTEPEVLVGAEQAFVYHYRVQPGSSVTLHRCASGLRTEACPCQNGGACLPMDRCACPSGFSGVRCELPTPSGFHFEAAADYSAERAGVAFLVDIAGQTVFERYEAGFGPNDAHHIFSATKALWALAAAAAVDDGLMSFDEPIAATYSEWAQDDRAAVTMRHVLTLSSGLQQDPERLQGEQRDTHASDKYAHARGLDLRCIRYPCTGSNWVRPGTEFNYGPVDYYIFGGVLKAKLGGEDPLSYLNRRIFDPIGLEWARWTRDEVGQAHLPNGAYLTVREWVKVGRLVLDGGRWGDAQVVRSQTLAALFEPSPANLGHGLFVWLNTPGGEAFVGPPPDPNAPGGAIYRGGHPDLRAGLGAGRNGIYMFPSLDMVVVRQCAAVPGNEDGFGCEDDFIDFWQDNDFIQVLLTGR